MGKKIKIARVTQGFSQKQLAQMVGTSPEYISKLETGKANNPTLDLMKKMARVLGVTIQELFLED